MNPTQWAFEYRGLQKKEEEEVKTQMMMKVEQTKFLKTNLIALLGLNLNAEAYRKAAEEETEVPYTPLSVLTGHPEMIRHLIDAKHEEAAVDEGLKDEAFDHFSKELQKQVETGQSDLPADMVPLIMDPVLSPREKWSSEEMQAALAAMGVRLTDPEPEEEDDVHA